MAVAAVIHQALGSPQGIAVRAYDGSRAGPDDAAATVVIERPSAFARLLTAPGELGLVRGYISGDLDLDGDLFALIELAFGAYRAPALSALVRAVGLTVREGVGALRPFPHAPAEEARLRGWRHSTRRDAAAISHHYDVSDRFYELVLGPSMTYSCAVFGSPTTTLEAAQTAKHELICTKLGLTRGDRLLDVGCGWGSLLLHAAAEHGVHGVGITVSRAQFERAGQRVRDAGLDDRIEIRLQDYRDVVDGPFDAISSVGMFEHVGRARLEQYVQQLHRLVADEGRLLNHGIGRPVVVDPAVRPPRVRRLARRVEVAVGSSRPSRIDSPLMQRYVFPDGELHEVGSVISLLQEEGFELRHVESLREHYGITLRRWVANLEQHWADAVAEVGEARARIWRLYMVASALGFEHHALEVHQALVVKPTRSGAAGLPLRPRFTVPGIDGDGTLDREPIGVRALARDRATPVG